MPAAASAPVKAALVNCEPWTPSVCQAAIRVALISLRRCVMSVSRKVAFQGSNGVEFGMPFCYPTGNVILGSLVGP